MLAVKSKAKVTIDDVRNSVPKNLRASITPDIVKKLNEAATDDLIRQNIQENFYTYANLLSEGKFKIEDYVNAITYVTYRIMDYGVSESWAMTFPQRHQRLVAQGKSAKDISAHASSYNKGKLVNLIMEQSLIPFWILNQGNRQKALNKQLQLMATASSEMVQMQAADSILRHTEKPKDMAPLVNIDMTESKGMQEMFELMNDLAQKQREAIKAGLDTRVVAEQTLTVLPKE